MLILSLKMYVEYVYIVYDTILKATIRMDGQTLVGLEHCLIAAINHSIVQSFNVRTRQAGVTIHCVRPLKEQSWHRSRLHITTDGEQVAL